MGIRDPHVKVTDEEEAGLTLLIEYGLHLPLVERLLKAGLDPNAALQEAWTNGHTPLLRAILAEEEYETWQCVEALLKGGADPNSPGVPFAALAGKHGLALGEQRFPDNVYRIAELLLEAGADATKMDEEGGNARWWFGGDHRLQELLDRFGVPAERCMPTFIAEYSPGERLAEALVYDHQAVAQQDLAGILGGTDPDVANAARHCISLLMQTESYGEHGAREGALGRLRTGQNTLAVGRPAAKQLIQASVRKHFR